MNEYILALLKCKGIGNNKLFKYIKDNNFDKNKIVSNIKFLINEDDYEIFEYTLEIAKKEIQKNLDYGIKIITIFDQNFPTNLYEVSDPILYLYYKGDINLINHNSITIIGTRNPSDNAKNDTYKISKDLSNEGYVIVSGLALGVDAIAHKACLDVKGKTIAILPTDLSNIQPSSNRKLADEIVRSGGCLVSEYKLGTPINKFNYAKRDRIQSALSNLIIVTEAAEDSGTMIAVKKSLKENKPVLQLETNKNTLINNLISISNNNYILKINSIIKDSAIKHEKEEIKTNTQITLFD